MARRFKFIVAYEGTHFHGWQRQEPPDQEPLRTVQGVLEQAIFDVTRQRVQSLGSSRTDSGVHARGLVVAFNCETELDPKRLAAAIGGRLPEDVQIRRACVVDDEFNPIGDATSKGYRYRIAFGGKSGVLRPLFDRRLVYWTRDDVNVERMNEAAQHLIGTHDFTSFTRKHHARESTVRTIFDCTVKPTREHRCQIEVVGDGFLHNMVRIIAGTLLDVGRERLTPEDVPRILQALDRDAAGPTLPPEGLCLMWVKYG